MAASEGRAEDDDVDGDDNEDDDYRGSSVLTSLILFVVLRGRTIIRRMIRNFFHLMYIH